MGAGVLVTTGATGIAVSSGLGDSTNVTGTVGVTGVTD